MDLFGKAASAILIALILVLTLGKQGQEIGILLTVAVCCMTGMAAIRILEPVLDFLYEIQALTYMDNTVLKTLLKLVGVGLTAEFISMICADAGCGSLGKSIQLLASAVILYLSIPILEQMLTLIREILGGV